MPLDVALDLSLGSGLRIGSGDGETISDRTPFYADVDVGFIFDSDFSSEWGLGVTVQMETQAAVAFTPQVRLLSDGPDRLRFYVGAGVPAFVTPYTLFGLELGGGALYTMTDRVSLTAGLAVDAFFLGSDLPEDGSLVMFNLGVGARAMF